MQFGGGNQDKGVGVDWATVRGSGQAMLGGSG